VATADVTRLAAERHEPAVRAAVARLARLGLPATAGLAATPLLALYAARRAAPVLVVHDSTAFLAPLPLSAAEPTPELAGILAGWGVRTLGQLTALAKPAVARRLGAAGVALWERAAGEAVRPLQPAALPRTFTAAVDFEHGFETLEPLLFVLRRCVDRLALELHAAGFVAAGLDLTLTLADVTEAGRSFRLPEPTGEADVLARALHSFLETLRTAAAVTGIRLQITPARPLVKQPDLFETGLRDPHGFAETLARTAALVGSDGVGAPQPADTHRPDVFTLVPPPAAIPSPASAPVHPLVGLPLRRFRPPQPATVELAGRAPAFVWSTDVRGAVAKVRGPWRGAGDWWRPDLAWEREEWDVALAEGGLYRVLHTPAGWFVEGEYD